MHIVALMSLMNRLNCISFCMKNKSKFKRCILLIYCLLFYFVMDTNGQSGNEDELLF